jgi:hypothetical protein
MTNREHCNHKQQVKSLARDSFGRHGTDRICMLLLVVSSATGTLVQSTGISIQEDSLRTFAGTLSDREQVGPQLACGV